MYLDAQLVCDEGKAAVPFCTMVEWDQDFSSDVYDTLTKQAADGLPDGCLCRMQQIGIDL